MYSGRGKVDRNARFSGRNIYLTGAASGIGRATARLLASGGARLSLVDIDRENLADVAREVDGCPFAVDLLDHDAVDRSVDQAAEAMGGIDVVINCAAIAHSCGIDALEPEAWDRVIAINLTAPFRVCRAALPYLRMSDHASIVNVASGVAMLPQLNAAAYAASKGGLISFTKALALELAPRIRANVLSPGITNTPIVSKVLESATDVGQSPFVAQYAMKRVADPAEIAEAIAFLASDDASFITGVTLSADGGRTFH